MADFYAAWGNRLNPGDRFCLRCGSKITLTSLHERGGEEWEKASPTMSLSQFTASKGEERRGFGKPHNGLKWKGKNTTANSKKTAENRVVINVAMMIEDEDCKLVVKRGSKEALKFWKDEVAAKVCKDAVKKHSAHDQFSM